MSRPKAESSDVLAQPKGPSTQLRKPCARRVILHSSFAALIITEESRRRMIFRVTSTSIDPVLAIISHDVARSEGTYTPFLSFLLSLSW